MVALIPNRGNEILNFSCSTVFHSSTFKFLENFVHDYGFKHFNEKYLIPSPKTFVDCYGYPFSNNLINCYETILSLKIMLFSFLLNWLLIVEPEKVRKYTAIRLQVAILYLVLNIPATTFLNCFDCVIQTNQIWSFSNNNQLNSSELVMCQVIKRSYEPGHQKILFTTIQSG